MSSMANIELFLKNITAGKQLKRAIMRVPDVVKDILESLFSTLPFTVSLLEFRANKIIGNFNLVPTKELHYELFACTNTFTITHYA
jgi:hypothetical protein